MTDAPTTHPLSQRLRELSDAVTQGREAVAREFTMRVPAEPDRDADLVLSRAADDIDRQAAEIARLRAEVEALRGDAERLSYARGWIRQRQRQWHPTAQMAGTYREGHQDALMEALAAIDAGRNTEGRSDG